MTTRSVDPDTGAILDEARLALGLTDLDLWLRYAALGGRRNRREIRDILDGIIEATRRDATLLSYALNERLFVELGGDPDIPPRAAGTAIDDLPEVVIDLRSQRTAERMQEQFLSRVGHELRTPMAGIVGFASLIGRPQVTIAEARRFAEEILDAAARLNRIIGLLEFAAIAVDDVIEISPRAVDVAALVTDLVDSWRSAAPETIEITLDVAADLPAVVADRAWVTRAVDELLDNAVKFSPAGGRIAVSVAPAPSRRAAVAIEVVDEGIGMDDPEMGVFDPFRQADPTDTRAFGGLGLGLALVRAVARAHGGSVSLRAHDGGGVRASIVVPASPSSRTAEVTELDAGVER